MTMTSTCYKELGIDITIQWNNRKLLSGLIIESGIEERLASKVILSVDKLAKIGESGVKKELKDYKIEETKLDKLFNFFKLDINNMKKEFSNTNNEILLEGLKEVEELDSNLKKLNLKECIFTPYLARGLEIYTGTVWEVFDKEKRVTSSIGAGGRYDKIITNFINDGNNYPAVGMTFGLVPIYEILKQTNKEEEVLYNLYIIPMDTEIECLKFANILRQKGIKVIIEYNKKKVSKAFNWAGRNNIPYVVVIGEDELKTGKLMIRDMKNSKDESFNIEKIDEIVDYLK